MKTKIHNWKFSSREINREKFLFEIKLRYYRLLGSVLCGFEVQSKRISRMTLHEACFRSTTWIFQKQSHAFRFPSPLNYIFTLHIHQHSFEPRETFMLSTFPLRHTSSEENSFRKFSFPTMMLSLRLSIENSTRKAIESLKFFCCEFK